MRTLRAQEARRIAVRAQLLDAAPVVDPGDLVGVVEHLTFLQLDPTAAIAPSADLISWSRMGERYRPADLRRALEVDRTLYEALDQDHDREPALAMVRPMSSLGLHVADMHARRSSSSTAARWVEANDAFRRRVLDQLAAAGPLASRDIPDTSAVPWQSSGWTHERNVTRMLELLLARGEVAVARRSGRQRRWDLAERVYPSDVVAVPTDEARRRRDERRLRTLGVARPRIVGDAGIEVEIDGTSGPWRVDPDASADGFEGRTALLSPFDRLIHDRVRAAELFGFEYVLEMYKPKDQRRWGYFALPVLHHDGLIGKVDASVDRRARALAVHAVHEDVPCSRATRAAVDEELDALASWLGLTRGPAP